MVPDSRIRVLEITHVDTAVGKPGVVDENVDWSKRSLGTVDAIAHGSQVGDVEIDSLCLYANGSDLSRARLGAIEMQVVDDEQGARGELADGIEVLRGNVVPRNDDDVELGATLGQEVGERAHVWAEQHLDPGMLQRPDVGLAVRRSDPGWKEFLQKAVNTVTRYPGPQMAKELSWYATKLQPLLPTYRASCEPSMADAGLSVVEQRAGQDRTVRARERDGEGPA